MPARIAPMGDPNGSLKRCNKNQRKKSDFNEHMGFRKRSNGKKHIFQLKAIVRWVKKICGVVDSGYTGIKNLQLVDEGRYDNGRELLIRIVSILIKMAQRRN